MSTLLKRLWVLGLALAAACGDGGPSKATAPSLTSITVSGSDLLLIGQSEAFMAVDNTGSAVTTPWWVTDAPSIVTVDGPTGRVTAVGVGTATVVATSSGVRGTKTVRTLPNFTGTWSGQYEDTRCEATGGWADARVCLNDPWGDLGTGLIRITLTQDRDTVSGRVSLLSPETEISGGVSTEGTLTFTGTARNQVVNVEFANVRFELSQTGEMTGTFEQVYTRPDFNGTYRVYDKLRTMHRSN
jgi:Bacterial Ig-like domain (group 2)